MLSQAPDLVDPVIGILDISTCRKPAGRDRDRLSVEDACFHTLYNIPWDCTLFTELNCHVAH